MKTITAQELNIILEDHKKWLIGHSSGKRANLRGANLRDADLRDADLIGVNLSYADLRDADLIGINLRGANLSYADLRDADLIGINLSYANLSGANLSGANLSYANLSGANLSYANLIGANIRYVIGNGMEIKTIQTDTWAITYTSETMSIGFQQHTLKEWFGFNEKQIKDMGKRELEFWTKWKPILEAIGVFEELEKWRIKPKKPVDLSVLIDSSIDCEFWDDADQKFPVIGKLTELGNPCISYKYVDVDGMDYKYCRPRMNHVHAWQGGECPLPDGLRVKVFYQNPHIEPAIYEVGSYNLTWHWYGTESDIIAFEVVGLVDGYCWPWEME